MNLRNYDFMYAVSSILYRISYTIFEKEILTFVQVRMLQNNV